jgi:hypothetical protein
VSGNRYDLGTNGVSKLTTSVLVTTYNGERFIDEQLCSIMNQTQRVDQVLICDDRSTDDTATRVREFIQKNALSGWTLIVNEENLGPGLNNLTHLCDLTGDIVFLADQDDVWEREKVETMSHVMAANPHTSLLVSRTTTVDEQGRSMEDQAVARSVARHSRVHRGSRERTESLGFVDFVGDSTVPLHAMCLRGDVVRTIGQAGQFPGLSNSLGADWYVGIWGTVMGQAQLLPDPLVRRRVHDANISLGGLRKTTLLSATPERRLQIMQEGRSAHLSLLEHPTLTHLLTAEQRETLEEQGDFMASRIAFAERPTARRALRLLSQLRLYARSTGALLLGMRLWIVDLLYAYQVNWRLRHLA